MPTKMKIRAHTILISDLHLGSKMCQSKELLTFLENIEVKYLILNGDIFDDLNFNRLDHWAWECFSQFRKMSNHCILVLNLGNHDHLHEKFMSCLLGIKVTKGFYWHVGNKRMFALHGDMWDVYIYRYKFISDIMTWFYSKLQDINGGAARKFVGWIKKHSKMLLKNSQAVKDGAIKLAKENVIHGIFCGHTHHAELEKINGTIYANSGTFESDIPTYIAIDEKTVKLYRWQNGKSTLLAEERL